MGDGLSLGGSHSCPEGGRGKKLNWDRGGEVVKGFWLDCRKDRREE